MPLQVHCNYCKKVAVQVTGVYLFGKNGRTDELFWMCAPCDAWVGVHASSGVPKGTLAKGDLRRLRIMAHSSFDALWEQPEQASNKREKAYHWLARQLKIDRASCHIGFFDAERCQRVIVICKEVVCKKRKGPR